VNLILKLSQFCQNSAADSFFIRVREATLSRGRTMRFVDHVCRRCTRRMQQVANIDANGSTPGLAAFLCVGCGSTDSVLVHPINGRRELERHAHAQGDLVLPLN
jgi:hypothetical protein